MPLNTDIILSGKGPDIMGSIESGLKMKDMMSDRKIKQAQVEEDAKVKNLMKASMVVNPDGSTSLDKKTYLGELAKINPTKALNEEKQFKVDDENERKQKFQIMKDHVEGSHILAMGSVDAPSYMANRQKAIEMGIAKPEELPEQYDPNFVKTLQMKTLSAAEQFQRMQKQEEFAHQDKTKNEEYAHQDKSKAEEYAHQDKSKATDFDRDIAKLNKAEELKRGGSVLDHAQAMEKQRLEGKQKIEQLTVREDAKLKELNAKDAKKAQTGEDLPIDKKHFVQTLSTQNANNTSIKSQIDSVLSNWDNLSDDQKVYSGQQLIKTLNSTIGKDAVGNQERDVLAGKLQFAMGNFTNGNPTQFGRDLEGFKEQAANVSKSIGGAMEKNQVEIDKNMGRTSAVAKAPPAGHTEDGYVFNGGDPSDPSNWSKKTAGK